MPPLLDAALRGTLVALLLLLALRLLQDRPRLPAARAGGLLALGLCVQVVGTTPVLEEALPLPVLVAVVAVSVANAALFWVFVQALFDDDFAFAPRHVAACAGAAALGAFNCAVVFGSASVLAPLGLGLQRALPLVFGTLAAWAAARHWQGDLLERRRRLRAFIVVAGIGYALVQVLLRLGAPHGRLSGGAAAVDVLALLFVVGVVAARLLNVGESELFPAPPLPVPAGAPAVPTPAAAPAARAGPADARLAEALRRAMVEERVYRTEELTLGALAARLSVPEYRLRRHINGELGHRNFNAYVNAFRLEEAQAALADPTRRALPILTIALDAGFQSIGPFNRAFKAATGLTPGEFRRQKLADS